MEPLGVQKRYIPHLKGLISGKVEPKDQGRGSTITLCHAHLKKAILYLKRAKAGASLERVERVHVHPLKIGNGCSAPVLRTAINCCENH